MAERFGSQTHPSGGVRFGSQTYAAINASAGNLAATETGVDVFAAAAQPSVNAVATLVESGSDSFSVDGISSLVHTLQAYETPTPDAFHALGNVVDGSLRFGSQTHPSGGLRFGAQSWAALGPNGPLAATESGADSFSASGFQVGTVYSFAAFDILASFVDYSSESLAAGVTGSLDDGYKVMLPIAGPGLSFTWELNEFGNPSLRLANLTGASQLTGVPWFVWDGSAWTQALFDVSDALQGAVFMVEVGDDVASFNGSQTRYGDALLQESGADFTVIGASVIVTGALSMSDSGSDVIAANGSAFHVGDAVMLESGASDAFDASGGLIVTGSVAAIEGAAADTFLGSAQTNVTGALAAAENGADSLASAGGTAVTGSFNAAESVTADTISVSGGLQITGTVVAAELGADTFAAVGNLERLGTASLIEAGADVAALAGAVAVAGALAANEDADIFDATGVRGFAGSLDAVEFATDRAVIRGITRDLPVVPDFDGHLVAGSATEQFTIESKQQAAAA